MNNTNDNESLSYLKSQLNPFAGPISEIPDFDMCPKILKGVRVTASVKAIVPEWDSSPPDILVLFTGAGRERIIRLFLYVSEQTSKWVLWKIIYQDENLDQTFKALRHVSSGIQLLANTISSTNFSLSGMVVAIAYADLPYFPDVHYNTLSSFALNQFHSTEATRMSEGVVLLTPPDYDDQWFSPSEVPNYIPGSEESVNYTLTQVKKVNNGGKTDMWTFNANSSVWKTNSTMPLEIDFDDLPKETRLGLARVRLNITGGTFPSNPAEGAIDTLTLALWWLETDGESIVEQAVTKTLATTIHVNGGVSRLMPFYIEFDAFLPSYLTKVTMSSGTALTVSSFCTLSIEWLDDTLMGYFGPGCMAVISQLQPDTSITITGVGNYEAVPKSVYAKNIPTNFNPSGQTPNDLVIAKSILHFGREQGLKFVYPLPMYRQLQVGGFFETLSRRGVATYHASSIWNILKKAGRMALPFATKAITAAATPYLGSQTASLLGQAADNIGSQFLSGSVKKYQACSAKKEQPLYLSGTGVKFKHSVYLGGKLEITVEPTLALVGNGKNAVQFIYNTTQRPAINSVHVVGIELLFGGVPVAWEPNEEYLGSEPTKRASLNIPPFCAPMGFSKVNDKEPQWAIRCFTKAKFDTLLLITDRGDFTFSLRRVWDHTVSANHFAASSVKKAGLTMPGLKPSQRVLPNELDTFDLFQDKRTRLNGANQDVNRYNDAFWKGLTWLTDLGEGRLYNRATFPIIGSEEEPDILMTLAATNFPCSYNKHEVTYKRVLMTDMDDQPYQLNLDTRLTRSDFGNQSLLLQVGLWEGSSELYITLQSESVALEIDGLSWTAAAAMALNGGPSDPVYSGDVTGSDDSTFLANKTVLAADSGRMLIAIGFTKQSILEASTIMRDQGYAYRTTVDYYSKPASGNVAGILLESNEYVQLKLIATMLVVGSKPQGNAKLQETINPELKQLNEHSLKHQKEVKERKTWQIRDGDDFVSITVPDTYEEFMEKYAHMIKLFPKMQSDPMLANVEKFYKPESRNYERLAAYIKVGRDKYNSTVKTKGNANVGKANRLMTKLRLGAKNNPGSGRPVDEDVQELLREDEPDVENPKEEEEPLPAKNKQLMPSFSKLKKI